MRIEFEKYLKNRTLLILTICWILATSIFAPRKKLQFNIIDPFSESLNNSNIYIYYFNTIHAYITCLFLTVICMIFINIDRGLMRSYKLNYLKKSYYYLIINKIISLGVICIIIYTVNILIYISLIYIRFNLSLILSFSTIVFFFLKYILSTYLFISILILFFYLTNKGKYRYLYLFVCTASFFLSIIKSNKYLTVYNWYINGLGYLRRVLSDRTYNPITDYKSEMLQLGLICILIVIFYLKYGKSPIYQN